MPSRKTERWRTEPDKQVRRATTRVRQSGMLEADLQNTIIEMCGWFGLYVYHTHDSRKSAGGFPDLVIIGDHGVLYRELKTEKGHLSKDQAEVLERLRKAGQDAAVWRPSDLALGAIRGELQIFSKGQ